MISREPVRHDCPVALILIDVINDFEFEHGDKLARYALPMARSVVRLKREARTETHSAASVPAARREWFHPLRESPYESVRVGNHP
jgi:hypothetical protein